MTTLKIHNVQIAKLVHVWDVRVKLNEDHVLTLAQLLEASVELPVIDITDKMEILDGRHRAQAYALVGRETIPARIHKSISTREALIFAFHSNETGPLPLTVKDISVVIAQLLKLGDTDQTIIMALKMPAKFLRPLISHERSRMVGVKLVKAKELMANGKSLKEAAEEAEIPEKVITQSLRQSGKVSYSLYNKLSGGITHQRNAIMAWMRRMQERIQEDYREGLITKEETISLWQRTKEMYNAANIKVNDYESRIR